MNILRKASIYVPRLLHRKSSFANFQNYVAVMEDECNSTVKERILHPLAETPSGGGNKVTIIGSGNVGIACALCILAQKISNEICIIGRNEGKLITEMLDLQNGSLLLDNATISAGTDYCISADSRICIITSGAIVKPGESRLSLTKTNADIMKDIIPKFVQTSPNSIILMVTNPVDIMAYVAWKVSGFPVRRVLGSGTTMDSAGFRFSLSQRLNLAATYCHGLIIGDHGDSCVPVWSGVNVSGVRLQGIDACIGLDENPQRFNEVYEEVKKAGPEVLRNKWYTNWAIALSCAAITEAILKNYNIVLPVTTCVKGFYDIDKEVFLSLPCVVNADGATAIIKQNLSELEIEQLQTSAEAVYKVQSDLKI